eukprot:TRINITY_DN8530_c0_g1_i2.p1 TRINITY_DN8530_c0_g1~~TRINITY_DN8530_c0_g1_i2.p1  ORF type:complete len:160 (+),score=17.56 TRINITY_DN8530_c0_g1_i2:44-523(+)
MPQRPIVTVYPHSSYNEQQKDARPEKDSSVASRMARFKQQYAERGMRRSVEAVLLTYQHNHPHIYLLQMNSSLHKLPGGRLRQGEDEEEGLLRKLHDKLGPDTGMSPEWSVCACESPKTNHVYHVMNIRTEISCLSECQITPGLFYSIDLTFLNILPPL